MALPASGQISINDIYIETGNENELNASLKNISDGTFVTINTVNPAANRPDGVAPHAMSEFYSYDHDLTSSSWGSSWSAGNQTIVANPGTTSYFNRSITFSGFTSDVIDVYFTVNSGVVRGGLSVATSTSAFPTNSATYYGVGSSTGQFTTSISINSSGTLYCRFKYIQHSSLYETSNRTIKIVADGETTPGFNLILFDDSGGGFP